MSYNDGYAEQFYAFVNNISTTDGGTHVVGFRSALTKVFNKYLKRTPTYWAKKSQSREIKLTTEDTREGLIAVLSIRVPNLSLKDKPKANLVIPK